MAELESLHGEKVRWFSDTSAIIDVENLTVDLLGGSLKAGRVTWELSGDWRRASAKIVQEYAHAWSDFDGKITLGISAYGFDMSARDVQKTGILLKQKLKKANVSLRLIPNADQALGTATSHHNKLGLSTNKVELLVVRARNGRIIIAESTGAQNITALARRDQGRPKRDAFVGMLPPKLAQIMINLATVSSRSSTVTTKHLQPETKATSGPEFSPGAKPFGGEGGRRGEQGHFTPRLLDPFCGTGVILQEAALMGYAVYGTDLSEKMIDYSRTNLEWLAQLRHQHIDVTLQPGDATTTSWLPPIDAIVCESYLGQPFSAPPSPSKLTQVRGNCNHIIAQFLENIASQIAPGTPLCVAVPAWRSIDGGFTHLPLIQSLEKLGYTRHSFKNIKNEELLYYREDQVVARELLVLTKA
jgi:tRNA G10  N-methylase Trm11